MKDAVWGMLRNDDVVGMHFMYNWYYDIEVIEYKIEIQSIWKSNIKGTVIHFGPSTSQVQRPAT